MEHHYVVFPCPAEIICIRTDEYFFSKINRESRHKASKSVNQIYAATGAEKELQFSVGIEINRMYGSAYVMAERYPPDSLAVLFLEAKGLMGILIKDIRAPRTGIFHLERSGRHNNYGITFKFRSLHLLERQVQQFQFRHDTFFALGYT